MRDRRDDDDQDQIKNVMKYDFSISPNLHGFLRVGAAALGCNCRPEGPVVLPSISHRQRPGGRSAAEPASDILYDHRDRELRIFKRRDTDEPAVGS
jgi:hypothetical protein